MWGGSRTLPQETRSEEMALTTSWCRKCSVEVRIPVPGKKHTTTARIRGTLSSSPSAASLWSLLVKVWAIMTWGRAPQEGGAWGGGGADPPTTTTTSNFIWWPIWFLIFFSLLMTRPTILSVFAVFASIFLTLIFCVAVQASYQT